MANWQNFYYDILVKDLFRPTFFGLFINKRNTKH